MRYVDELQCSAARVVAAIRDHVRQRHAKETSSTDTTDTASSSGEFDTFHIRRGDFQYKETRIEAQEIYDNVKDVLVDGTTIYIATDEHDKSFFKVLQEHYDVLFLSDFLPQLEGVNKNHFGMIDQLVASRGRKFFGCWHST
jgi:GDP-fucose protein O-fucosyltransferase